MIAIGLIVLARAIEKNPIIPRNEFVLARANRKVSIGTVKKMCFFVEPIRKVFIQHL